MKLNKKLFKKVLFKVFSSFIKLYLRRKSVFLKRNVRFNAQSVFEGGIKIYQNCNVCNTYIGYGTYIAANSNLVNCKIGRYNSIAGNVVAVIGRHPLAPFVTTHPAFFSTLKQSGFTYVKGNRFHEFKYADPEGRYSVIIGNDVWIGYGVKIMEGVQISDGAIIAAGSVVTKNVPPYEIWAGIPARKIKDRFSTEDKEKLLSIKWWEKSESYLIENVDKFQNINSLNI